MIKSYLLWVCDVSPESRNLSLPFPSLLACVSPYACVLRHVSVQCQLVQPTLSKKSKKLLKCSTFYQDAKLFISNSSILRHLKCESKLEAILFSVFDNHGLSMSIGEFLADRPHLFVSHGDLFLYKQRNEVKKWFNW